MRVPKLCLPVALVAACTQGSQEAPAAPTQAAAETAPAAPAAAQPVKEQDAYVLYGASSYKQPTDDKKVKNNWLAMLYRGETVTLLEQQGDWSHIRMSDGKEGWMKSAALLPGDGVSMATVVDDVKTFSRPDFTTVLTKLKLSPGSVLFVTKKKDETFSEVNYSGTQTAWVEDAKLVRDANEVAAARVVSRAKALDESKDDEAKKAAAEMWDLANSKFKDTQVVQKVTAAATPATTEAQQPVNPASQQ